jgi:hypothetical protein
MTATAQTAAQAAQKANDLWNLSVMYEDESGSSEALARAAEGSPS